MILFPPSAAVTVVIDGVPLRAYHAAYVRNGRTYAPVRPYLTRAADRIWRDGATIVVQRGSRMARFDGSRGDVPLAPVLRALGADVTYQSHRVLVRFPPRAVALPTPFDAQLPSAAPRIVFTPEPVATPRPVWSGSPLPRRTPLPVTEPTP